MCLPNVSTLAKVSQPSSDQKGLACDLVPHMQLKKSQLFLTCLGLLRGNPGHGEAPQPQGHLGIEFSRLPSD